MKLEIEVPEHLAATIRAGQAFYEVSDELFESVARKMIIEGFESHIVRGERFDFADFIAFDSREDAQRIARKIVQASDGPNRWIEHAFDHVKLEYQEGVDTITESVPELIGADKVKALLGEPIHLESHT